MKVLIADGLPSRGRSREDASNPPMSERRQGLNAVPVGEPSAEKGPPIPQAGDVLGPVRGESHADEPLGPGTVGQFYAVQAEPWTLTLDAPTDQATRLDVAGTFEFMEAVIPDRGTTAEAQSVRLLQVSTLFIDRCQHDVDALRFRNADGLVTAYSAPDLASSLLPVTPSVMDPEMPMFDSLPTDALGQPHGNTPS